MLQLFLESPSFSQFHSTASHFRVTGHFKTSALKDPKVTLNTKRSKPGTPYACLQLPTSPICYNVRSTGFFSTYRPFWDKCTNNPQMTLNTKRAKLPQVQVTTTTESQISLHFALQPAISCYRPFPGEVHQMTAKWHWTHYLKGQRYPHTRYNYNVPVSPKFHMHMDTIDLKHV